MQGQLVEGHVKQVQIRYVGELVRLPLAPLTNAFVKGLLTPAMQESVNYVNAAMIAKERGIQVSETKATEAEDFANLISTVVETDKMKYEIHGTLFTRSDPRIVRMNEFYVDAVPSGPMLIIRNQDKPGMIGQMGTLLGSKGINIGWMTLGRKQQGSDALMVFNLDQAVPPELLEEIRRVPSVLYAKLIKL